MKQWLEDVKFRISDHIDEFYRMKMHDKYKDLYYGETKTESSYHTFPIPQNLSVYLRQLKKRQLEQRMRTHTVMFWQNPSVKWPIRCQNFWAKSRPFDR